jgi:microcystin-dependent protein
MAGVVNTTNTFSNNDVITSTSMNNIIDETFFTSDAIVNANTTLAVVAGKLKVGTITSNEMGTDAVTANALADGAVTQAKASNMLVPAGAIMPFAMNGAPTGWLAADGASVSTSAPYDLLFAAIGYTYGGSGTSFNVPDLRGYFVRGVGTNSDGTVSGTFAVKQADELKSHTHSGRVQTTLASGGSVEEGQGQPNWYYQDAIGATGGTETRPRNIAMLYCIKF